MWGYDVSMEGEGGRGYCNTTMKDGGIHRKILYDGSEFLCTTISSVRPTGQP